MVLFQVANYNNVVFKYETVKNVVKSERVEKLPKNVILLAKGEIPFLDEKYGKIYKQLEEVTNNKQ
jgi:hypothetical protein